MCNAIALPNQQDSNGWEKINRCVQKVHDDDAKQKDLCFHTGGLNQFAATNDGRLSILGDRLIICTPECTADIFNWANIPVGFGENQLKRNPTEFIPLITKIVQDRASDQSNPYRLMRMYEQEGQVYARAFLSSRYNIYLSNVYLANHFLDWCRKKDIPAEDITISYDPFKSLSINVILQRSTVNEEQVGFGIRAYNSELGHSSFMVDFYVEVLICLNGMKRRESAHNVKQVHLAGVLEPGTYDRTDRENGDPNIIMGSPYSSELTSRTINQLTALNTTPMLKEPRLETIEEINDKYNLHTSKSQDQQIHYVFFNSYKENHGRPLNAWGYWNAVTNVAKRDPDENGLVLKSENILRSTDPWVNVVSKEYNIV